jgi:hypothetical protein
MLTAQVGWSVPFSVTPPNSLQHLQKAAETISAGKNVDETQGLSSCGTVRCDGRQTDASRTENPESCCKIFSLPPWCTAYDVVNSRRVHLRRTLGPIYFTDFRSKFRLRLIRVFEVVASIRIRLDDLLIDAE